MKIRIGLLCTLIIMAIISHGNFAQAQNKKPNIIIIWGDDIGQTNITAYRASFITGQCGLRTGLTKVGLPGADVGLQKEDVTIAELLKAQGYATGQFGKNHLGDKDDFLPTNHGFDEFYGSLYHLNAEEEPELRDYPGEKDLPGFRAKYGPRGIIHSWANADGTQKVEEVGPLTKKRMETVDDEFATTTKSCII